MSARNLQYTKEAPRRDGSGPRGSRRARARAAWALSIAAAATAASIVVLIVAATALGSFLLSVVPGHHGVAAAAGAATSSDPQGSRQPGSLAAIHEVRATVANVAQAQVSIAADASTVSIPRSFFGISTEYWALPLWARHMTLFERVLSLLHVQGDGPMLLRIGGDSADHSFWQPGVRKPPRWMFDLTPSWLRQATTLVRQLGVRLIVDLNLVTDSPSTAAQWAQAAITGLPPGSIAGFEVGNEPDIYNRHYWMATVRRTPAEELDLPQSLSPFSYTEDFANYARVLEPIAPSVPLIGPAVANPVLDSGWISGLLSSEHPGLGEVSGHWYPYSACVSRRSPSYPTISRLLSEHATAGVARGVRATVALAHRAGLPFRLTELNSVTCGGLRGVSNTFATALWAPDALFELLRAGVDGVNVHVRAHAINAPFVLDGRGLTARPLLYGLLLFTRTLGADPRLVSLRLHAKPGLHLKAWAVRVSGNTLHVLLIDKGPRAVSVELRLPSTGPATVERLLAPSAESTGDVTLGGQQLGASGTWEGRPADEALARGARGYSVTIGGQSAALVSVDVHSGGPPADSSAARDGSAPLFSQSGRRGSRHLTADNRASSRRPRGRVAVRAPADDARRRY